MVIETDDYGPVDIGVLEGDALAEAYAELKEQCDVSRTHASYGIDFANGGRLLVIADRSRAVARLGEEAVKRLEADEEEGA